MDADRIVAARLLQMIVAEAGCALNELSVSARALEGWTGSAATADDRLLNFLAQKYVLDDHAPEWVASALSRRSELFLTANCDDAGVSQCLGALVPGKDFSALLYDESWSSPPLFMIAQGLSSLRAQETPVDAAYLQCCQLSLIKLAAKELICDINSLTQGESRPGPLAETREIIGRSPKTSGPAPLIILRETKLYIPGEDEKNDSPQDSHMLTDVHDLLALAWNYHKKWDAGLSRGFPKIVALTESPATVVQCLMLGFKVISHPVLPIHGSDLAEKFFCKDIELRLGGRYIMPGDQNYLPDESR